MTSRQIRETKMSQDDKRCGKCKRLYSTNVFWYRGKMHATCALCAENRQQANNVCRECGIRAVFNFAGEIQGIFCSQHKLPNMVDVKHKQCEYHGCDTRPHFDFIGGKGRFCAEHKLLNMVNVRSKQCEHDGCDTQPCFDFLGGKGRFCAEHKLPNMVDVKNKQCEYHGCDKVNPCFDFLGGKGRFCAEHKLPNMVDVKHKRCEYHGCDTHPCFDFLGGKGRFCAEHRLPNMVDVRHKQCEHDGCDTQPHFDFLGGKGRFCAEHKLPNMVDVKHKRCEYYGCDKVNPCFDFLGGKGRFCAEHRLPNMVNVRDKQCEHHGCKVRARYGIPCNPPTACTQHKQDGMIVHPMRKCRKRDCNNIAEYGIQNPVHCELHKTALEICLIERECTRCKQIDRVRNGLCVNSCCMVDDNERYKSRQKFREKRVIRILTANYKAPTRVGGRCQYACAGRQAEEKEIQYDYGTHKVFVEVDENQHSGYCAEGEVKRMINIYDDENDVRRWEDGSHDKLPVLFIRFNPDNYKKIRTPLHKREEELIRWLRYYEDLTHLSGHDLSVHYLYYDHDPMMEMASFPIAHEYPKGHQCPKCHQSFFVGSYYDAHIRVC